MQFDLPIGVPLDAVNTALASFGFDPKDVASLTLEHRVITAELFVRSAPDQYVVAGDDRATITVRIPVTRPLTVKRAPAGGS